MSQNIEINAEVRTDVGKGASRRLRRSGELVPGIIYGAEEDPVSLTLNANELSKAMQSGGFLLADPRRQIRRQEPAGSAAGSAAKSGE